MQGVTADRSVRYHNKVFIGIIILVHALFFIMALGYRRIYMGDSFEYIYEAINIKQQFLFYSGNAALPLQPEYMTQRQPGYPLLLLGVYLFTLNNWLVLLLQNILSIVNISYGRQAMLKLGYSTRYDWLLLLFTIAYPAQFINANTIAPDVLLQSCTLLYAGCFISFYQLRQAKYSLYMSMALAAGLMVKPVLYPFAFIHVALMVLYYRKRLRPAMLAVAAIPLSFVLLYNYINLTRTGKFHFSSNQSFNAIYYFNNYFADKYGADSASRFLRQERSAIAAMTEYKDRYNHANARGMALLRQHFLPYMAYHIRHSARIFIEPGKAEIDLFTGRLTYGRLYSKEQSGFYATLKKDGWRGIGGYIAANPSMPLVLLILLFNIARLAGLFIFFRSARVPAGIRVFIFIFLSYFAVAAGPIANTRYFLPVSLLAIGCSVLGYQQLAHSRQAHT